MRIGILSDTHDRHQRTALAVARLRAEGVEALVHCGDITTPEVVYELAGLPSHFVLGNNDDDESALRWAIGAIEGVCLGHGGEVTLAGRRIAVTHGDRPDQVRRLRRAAPAYLLSGHTHQRLDRRDGPTRLINPGALHRAAEYTVACLDLDTEVLTFLKI